MPGCRHRNRFTSGLAGLVLCLLLCLVLAGCESLDLAEDLHLPGFEPTYQVPDRITDVWSDTVLHQTGKPGVRGFGGRIIFHVDGEDRPVRADGTLTIYAFDERSEERRVGEECRSRGSPDH